MEIDTLNDSYEPALKALLTAPDRPTAVLVSDDILAVVLEQFCSKLGLRIPKDLSIVSFNNSLFSRITNPPLTTVDVNPYQLGIEAASQTINHIENPNLLATKILVPHKLIPRGELLPAGSLIKTMRPFPLFLREAERPHFAYFFRYSRGVMPKCALNARLK